MRTKEKHNTHVTPGPEIKPRPQWWELSPLTTLPFLLPCFSNNKHRHAVHTRVILLEWVDYLEHCEWYLHFYKLKEEYERGKERKCRISSHTGILWWIMCVVQITVTKKKLYWCHVYLLVQNADCRLDKKCRPGTKCRLQTAERVQNTDWESKELFCLVCDNMSSRNLPSVTQSLFRDQLSRLFALLWNIPGPFLDQNRS